MMAVVAAGLGALEQMPPRCQPHATCAHVPPAAPCTTHCCFAAHAKLVRGTHTVAAVPCAVQCVESGPAGPTGETYIVNMGDILDMVKLQQLCRVLMDK